MKRMVLVGALVGAFAVSTAFAQTEKGHAAPKTQPATAQAATAPEGQVALGSVHIPKSVKADGKALPAGTYQVTNLNRQAGISMFRLADENSREAIIAVPRLATDARQAWVAAGKPLLSFECTDSRCALTSLWVGRGYPAFVLYQPKLGRDEHARTATVIMRPVKSE